MTLLFKIHYFLWYGGHTSIFGYESVYARYYTNASTVQFGTLRMILPFVAVIVTPIVCLNADRRHRHRLYFTVSLIIALISLMAYTFLPLTMLIDEYQSSISNNNSTNTNHSQTIVYRRYSWIGYKQTSVHQGDVTRNTNRNKDLWLGPFIFYCLISLIFELALAVNTCLSDSYAVLQAEEHGTTFGRIIVWGTFGWAFSAFILSIINQQAVVARLLPGLLFGVGLLTIDSILVSLWCYDEDFKLDLIAMEAARSLTGSSSSGHRKPSDYMPLNEANLINMGAVMTAKGRQGTPRPGRRRKIKRSSEILFGDDSDAPHVTVPRLRVPEPDISSLIVSPRSPMSSHANSPVPLSPRSPLSADPRSAKSPTSEAIKTINSDYISPQNSRTTSPIQADESFDPYSKKDPVTPAQTTAALIDLKSLAGIIDPSQEVKQQTSGIDTKFKDKQSPLDASLKIQLSLFYLILKRRKSLIRFLLMFVLSGIFMSMQWNYFFLYLEDTYRDQFELISALSMVGQSILGELPFFILSRKIINRFGRSHTLSISMISIGVRFMLYRFLLGPRSCMYFVFLADCLQGPTYGLFYVVMTEVGLEYSFCDDATLSQLIKMKLLDGTNQIQVDAVRLALRSTVQSVAFACYEGLGVGLGSLLGGVILQHYSFDTLWFWMAVSAITLGLVNTSIELFCREADLSDGAETFDAKRTILPALELPSLSSSSRTLKSDGRASATIPADEHLRARVVLPRENSSSS